MTGDERSFAERRAELLGAAAERELTALREQLLAAETALAEVPDLREAALEGERQRERADALQAREEEQLEATRAELRRTTDELKLARDERDALRTAIRQIETSASWRVTAPLRAARRRAGDTRK